MKMQEEDRRTPRHLSRAALCSFPIWNPAAHSQRPVLGPVVLKGWHSHDHLTEGRLVLVRGQRPQEGSDWARSHCRRAMRTWGSWPSDVTTFHSSDTRDIIPRAIKSIIDMFSFKNYCILCTNRPHQRRPGLPSEVGFEQGTARVGMGAGLQQKACVSHFNRATAASSCHTVPFLPRLPPCPFLTGSTTSSSVIKLSKMAPLPSRRKAPSGVFLVLLAQFGMRAWSLEGETFLFNQFHDYEVN